MSEQLKQDVAADRAAGLTFRQIAAKRGVPVSRVYRLAKAAQPETSPAHSATHGLLDDLRERAAGPATPTKAHGQAETYEMLRAELGRLKETVEAGMPLTPLEMKRVADVEARLTKMAPPDRAPKVHKFEMASISELRLLRCFRSLQEALDRREAVPEPDPLIELAVKLLELASGPRAATTTVRLREQAAALLAGTLVPRSPSGLWPQ